MRNRVKWAYFTSFFLHPVTRKMIPVIPKGLKIVDKNSDKMNPKYDTGNRNPDENETK